jgi:hypothetical protein
LYDKEFYEEDEGDWEEKLGDSTTDGRKEPC